MFRLLTYLAIGTSVPEEYGADERSEQVMAQAGEQIAECGHGSVRGWVCGYRAREVEVEDRGSRPRSEGLTRSF